MKKRKTWVQVGILYAVFIAARLVPGISGSGIWLQMLKNVVFYGHAIYAALKWDKACSRYWRLHGHPEKTDFSNLLWNPVDRRTGVEEIDILLSVGYIWLGTGICLGMLDIIVLIPLSRFIHPL